MTRKRMRSVPFGRLAGFQCLMVSLVVCSSKYAGAWVPSSSLAQRKSLTQSTTTLYAEDGVLKFVKGLDSALGNPTAYSAATAASKAPAVSSSVTAVQSSGGAATMTVPNSILLAGGFAAFLAFLGIAFFFVSQKEGPDFFDDSALDTSFNAQDVTPVPKRSPSETVEPKIQNEPAPIVAETKIPEPKAPEPPSTDSTDSDDGWGEETPAPVTEPKATETKVPEVKIPEPPSTDFDFEEESSGGGILAKIKAKLSRTTEELEETTELLATESELRKESESKLESATAQNEALEKELETKEQDLVETTEKWTYTKTKLQEEVKLKETLEAELKVASEENRVLEDQYELGQNSLMKTQKELSESNEKLEATQNRLTRTQGELSRIHGRLQITQKVLDETSEELERLEAEDKSVRNLGGKMWSLSKSRVTNRIRSVTDRLRGRGPKKNKKSKRFKK